MQTGRAGPFLLGWHIGRGHVNDDRGPLVTAQPARTRTRVVDGGQRDLGHPGQRRGMADPLGPGQRLDGALHDRAVPRVQPGVQPPLRLSRPGMRHELLRRRALLPHRAQPADHRLQLADRAVLGDLDQIRDELVFPVVGEPGNRPHLRVGQATRGHRLGQLREPRQRPGHPHMLHRGPPG